MDMKKQSRQRRWYLRNPWFRFLHWAKTRCVYETHKMYPRYGGRGIKFFLTLKEIKEIWIRDSADKLKRPSLDRINPDGHYEFSNCRFIELRDNVARNHE